MPECSRHLVLEKLVDFFLIIVAVNYMELWKAFDMTANRLLRKFPVMRHKVDLYAREVSLSEHIKY